MPHASTKPRGSESEEDQADGSLSFAVVIPAYNEASTIRQVVEGCLQHVKHISVIDDGSSDHTALMLEGLPVQVIRHGVNRGKAAGLWRGFQEAMQAGANAIISIDGDGQHAPADIPKLVHVATRIPNAFIVGARRRTWGGGAFWRVFANKMADFWVSWAAGYPIEDSQSGFRIYPADLIRKANVKQGKAQSFVFESEILIEGARLGFESIPVPIETASRHAARPSHFRPALDVLRITRMVARKLLCRGMYPRGLYRSLFGRPRTQGGNPWDGRKQNSFPASVEPFP